MLRDLLEIAASYLQYLLLLLQISPNSFPSFYASPSESLRYLNVDLITTAFGEANRYKNTFNVPIPTWIPLDYRLQFAIVSVLGPLLIAILGMFFLSSKIFFLWFTLLLGGVSCLMLGITGTVDNGSILKASIFDRSALSILLVVGIVLTTAVFIAGLAVFLWQYLTDEDKEANDRKALANVVAQDDRGTPEGRESSVSSSHPLVGNEAKKKKRFSLTRFAESVSISKAADDAQESSLNGNSTNGEERTAKERLDHIMQLETQSIDVIATLSRAFYFALFATAGLFCQRVFVIEVIRDIQFDQVLYAFSGVFFAIAFLFLIWFILGLFRWGRELQFNVSVWLRDNFVSMVLLLFSVVYTPAVTNMVTMFTCHSVVCPADTHLPIPNSLLRRAECFYCNQTNVTQQCPTSLQQQVCSAASTSARRLIVDLSVDCNDVGLMLYISSACMLAAFVIAMPMLYIFLTNRSTKVVETEFPLDPRLTEGYTNEDRYNEKVHLSDNVAKFIYDPYQMQYKHVRLLFIVQKLAIVVATVMTQSAEQQTLSPVFNENLPASATPVASTYDKMYATIGFGSCLGIHLICFTVSAILRPFTRRVENAFCSSSQGMLCLVSLMGLLEVLEIELPEEVPIVIAALIFGVPFLALVVGAILTFKDDMLRELQREERIREAQQAEQLARNQAGGDNAGAHAEDREKVRKMIALKNKEKIQQLKMQKSRKIDADSAAASPLTMSPQSNPRRMLLDDPEEGSELHVIVPDLEGGDPLAQSGRDGLDSTADSIKLPESSKQDQLHSGQTACTMREALDTKDIFHPVERRRMVGRQVANLLMASHAAPQPRPDMSSPSATSQWGAKTLGSQSPVVRRHFLQKPPLEDYRGEPTLLAKIRRLLQQQQQQSALAAGGGAAATAVGGGGGGAASLPGSNNTSFIGLSHQVSATALSSSNDDESTAVSPMHLRKLNRTEFRKNDAAESERAQNNWAIAKLAVMQYLYEQKNSAAMAAKRGRSKSFVGGFASGGGGAGPAGQATSRGHSTHHFNQLGGKDWDKFLATLLTENSNDHTTAPPPDPNEAMVAATKSVISPPGGPLAPPGPPPPLRQAPVPASSDDPTMALDPMKRAMLKKKERDRQAAANAAAMTSAKGVAGSPSAGPTRQPSGRTKFAVVISEAVASSAATKLAVDKKDETPQEEVHGIQGGAAGRRKHIVLRRKLQELYAKEVRKLQLTQQAVDFRINRSTIDMLNLFFVYLGFLALVATMFAALGAISTAPDDFLTGALFNGIGTHGKNGASVAAQFSTYESWANFTASCCCVASLNQQPEWPYYVVDVEEWACENGVVKERVRKAIIDGELRDGYGIRKLCSVTFEQNCRVEVVPDSHSVNLTNCDSAPTTPQRMLW